MSRVPLEIQDAAAAVTEMVNQTPPPFVLTHFQFSERGEGGRRVRGQRQRGGGEVVGGGWGEGSWLKMSDGVLGERLPEVWKQVSH